MIKTFIAGLTAISLTAAAGPVQAQGLDEEQIGKVLFGLVATTAIASIIRNNRDKPAPVEARGSRDWKDQSETPRAERPRHEQPRDRRDQWSNRALPDECLTTHRTRYGTIPMFGRGCMQRNYRQVTSLPKECSVRVIARNGPQGGWDPHCLRDFGYRAAHRR